MANSRKDVCSQVTGMETVSPLASVSFHTEQVS
jgi:hypothetical protein